MSAATVAAERNCSTAAKIAEIMPSRITLDDVAAMADADERHRYELSREGILLVMPPATPEHGRVVSRLVHWLFISNGLDAAQVTVSCGVYTGGGRQPDVTVWAKDKPPRRAKSSYAGTDGLLLAIEVLSPDSKTIDRIEKRNEYAVAGIPRYWMVDLDEAKTVHSLRLENGEFVVEYEPQPLTKLLNGPVPPLD